MLARRTLLPLQLGSTPFRVRAPKLEVSSWAQLSRSPRPLTSRRMPVKAAQPVAEHPKVQDAAYFAGAPSKEPAPAGVVQKAHADLTASKIHQ